MSARGCVILAVLLKCVLSVPVSTGHMENEDVQVMKCIVEVLADVLSKPRTIPVSHQCLQTLRSDDRLVSILRHRNFLQELQDIALEGAKQRPEKRMKDDADYVSHHHEGAEMTAVDQSMLVAMERLGGEKEREKKEKEEKRGEEEEESDGEEHNKISSQEKKRNEEEEEEEEEKEDRKKEDQEHKRGVMKKKGKDEEDEEEKRSNSEEEEEEEEEDEAAGAGDLSQVKKSVEEKQESVEKQREDPEEKKEKMKTGVKHWRNTEHLSERRAEEETSPHSREELGQGQVWKSPEEQELQMMARRDSEDRREEEGSASKKTEDAEIESLAAIESELENVAQKLHELRHG